MSKPRQVGTSLRTAPASAAPPCREADAAALAAAEAEANSLSLLHELQVHQEELAQQNESLQETRDQLSASLSRYVELYETAPVGMLTLDRQTTVLQANRRSREMLGLDASIGSKMIAHLNAESQGLLWRAMAVATPASPGASLVLSSRDGLRSFEAEIGVGAAAGDNVALVLTDISNRVRAEAKLARMREMLELSNRAARIGHWSFDLEPNRWTWSSMAHEILPIPSDLAGDFEAGLVLIKAGDSRERLRAAFAAALRRGEPFDLDLQVLRADGSERWVRALGKVDSVQGREPRLYGTLQDIDDRVQAERIRVERAEAANRGKSAFLANVSHELRTPLSAVLGFSELLARDEAVLGSEMASQQLGYIADAGKHLLALVDNLLDLARVEAGELKLLLEPVEIGPLLAECLMLISRLAEGRRISLPCSDVAAGLVVLADRTRLRQVLLNLLSNAVKYNREGGSIAVALTCQGAELSIAISDNGSGLLPEQLATLFQPFNRLGAEASQTEGTGLGLVITRQLVEAMGGRLAARSSAGLGSVFTVCLPVAPGTGVPVGAEVATGTDQHNDVMLPLLRVLYVEDNRVLAEMMRQFFRRMDGVELEIAGDGEAGIQAARRRRPDLLLLDINLPRLNGFEVLALVRADPDLASVRCVAVSAIAMDSDVERALSAGFDDYITKPFSLGTIRQLVDKLRD
ncbi:MAG: PAS domain-containing sensor histidine kinase [Betaproteobacteria bacterium]|nr:PAS domain-containing sensor histidine kinase [Betaproteobacteria bacterium]